MATPVEIITSGVRAEELIKFWENIKKRYEDATKNKMIAMVNSDTFDLIYCKAVFTVLKSIDNDLKNMINKGREEQSK